MQDDLNVSKALSVLESMLSSTNEKLDQNPKNKALKGEILANLKFIEELLGIGFKDPSAYFQLGVSESEKQEIESKIEERKRAKEQKDFLKADSIREELLKQKIALMDTPQGTIWEKFFKRLPFYLFTHSSQNFQPYYFLILLSFMFIYLNLIKIEHWL